MKKILLLAVVCVFWFSLYLYVPFLTPYLISLGVTATLAGVIFAAHSFVQLVLRFPVGLKSDMLGRQKPFIVLGMVFSAIASILMYFFPSPAMLFAGNAISGVSSTMYVHLRCSTQNITATTHPIKPWEQSARSWRSGFSPPSSRAAFCTRTRGYASCSSSAPSRRRPARYSRCLSKKSPPRRSKSAEAISLPSQKTRS